MSNILSQVGSDADSRRPGGRFDRFRRFEQFAPADAELLWLSSRIPNDQFLLYGFDGPGPAPAALPGYVAERVAGITDLRLRVREVPGDLDYPYWVPDTDTAPKVIEHDLVTSNWSGLASALGELLGRPLDPRSAGWRLHVYREVVGAPGCVRPATVVVLQIAHALADGRRASAAARALFGPPTSRGVVPAAPSAAVMVARAAVRTPVRQVATVALGLWALRAYRRFGEPTTSGGVPLSPLNLPAASADAAHAAAMIVLPARVLRRPGATVTGVVSAAVGDVLRGYWPEHPRWAAEVTVAARTAGRARNNFRNVGIDLRADLVDPDLRRAAVGTALRAAARPSDDPLRRAQGRVRRALPAPVLRREVVEYPLDRIPPTVTGNTVISSVYRGAADLRFGAAPVRFTAGFPALSPVMGLTHGVHGIGDTITIGLHARTGLLDLDRYADALRAVLAGSDP